MLVVSGVCAVYAPVIQEELSRAWWGKGSLVSAVPRVPQAAKALQAGTNSHVGQMEP